MTHLQRAVEYLGAERLGRDNRCQICRRYRYWDNASGAYHMSDAADLRDLGRRLEMEQPDAYIRWCADTPAWSRPHDE